MEEEWNGAGVERRRNGMDEEWNVGVVLLLLLLLLLGEEKDGGRRGRDRWGKGLGVRGWVMSKMMPLPEQAPAAMPPVG